MIGNPLCDQFILAMIEFTIQRVGPSVESLPEALMPFPCLMAAFACGILPSLGVGQSFFQSGSPPGYLRVFDLGLRKTVIDIQTKRQ
jgi:hypothetical protein